MRRFEVTFDQTLEMLVFEMLQRINPRGKGCCYHHVGLLVLQQCISMMTMRPCNHGLKPFDGWQCRDCRAMNELDPDCDDWLACTTCVRVFPVTEHEEEQAPVPLTPSPPTSNEADEDDEGGEASDMSSTQ